MKLVIQKVKNAKVEVGNDIIGKINEGFLVLLGIGREDNEEIADALIKKLLNLRVFEDENDKMNLSIKDIKGELLIVSQFTLYADCTKGNRPSFIKAADPEKAMKLYEYFKKRCEELGYKVESGKFGAHMKINLLNDGPVTIILEK